MQTDQQGLFLLTILCSLISLLSSCFILLTSAISGLWKKSSTRLLMYLSLTNILTNLVLMLPTYKYSFMCSFQSHLLNFALISELALGSVFIHYAYYSTIQCQKLSSKIEARYLALSILPALVLSIPPIYPETFKKDCWEYPHSPLSDVVGSYGFLIPFMISSIFCYALILAFIVNLKLNFPQGFYTEDYVEKINKFKRIGKYSLMVHGYMGIIVIYAILIILELSAAHSLDFVAMFCHASCGSFNLGLFLSSQKVKEKIASQFGQKKKSDLLEEDSEDFMSIASVSKRLAEG